MNKTFTRLLLRLIPLALPAIAASASVVYTETFTDGNDGWIDRDSGEMSVSHQASVGSPSSAAMQGSFGASPLPMTDAFTINSGSDFVGDYTSYGNGLTQISFDLYAETVLPSDLFIILVDGANTFTYQFNLGSMMVDSWTTFTVDLDWNAGWNGASEAAFDLALTSVDQLEIQLTRNGSGSQLFYLDDITTYDSDSGGGEEGGGSGSAVPEPGTGLMILGGMMLLAVQRHRRGAIAVT